MCLLCPKNFFTILKNNNLLFFTILKNNDLFFFTILNIN